MTKITIIQGDITKQHIDAIVNATMAGAQNPNIDDDNAANEGGTSTHERC